MLRFPTPTRLRRTPSCSRGRIIHAATVPTHQRPKLPLLKKRGERSGGSSYNRMLQHFQLLPGYAVLPLAQEGEFFAQQHATNLNFHPAAITAPLKEEGQATLLRREFKNTCYSISQLLPPYGYSLLPKRENHSRRPNCPSLRGTSNSVAEGVHIITCYGFNSYPLRVLPL